MDIIIRNAAVPGQPGSWDIGIDAGVVVAVEGRIEATAGHEIDAQGNLVSAGFVDAHTHLDKALVLDRYDWSQREMQATPRLTSMTESDKLKRDFTVDDVRRRAVRLARMCAANGTTALRTHVDIDPVVGLTGMEGVLAAREECRGLVDIQISPYAIRGFEGSPESEALLRRALDMGADLVGGVPEADKDGNGHVDKVFALAEEYGLGIDFHTDQVRAARPFALPYIAEKTMATGMQGQVMASHCFALGHVPAGEHQHAIDLCSRAEVSICVTPYVSMRERVALPREAGVNVTYMSDNIQDAWQPHGNGDMLLLAIFTARLTPFNTNQELDSVLEMGTLGAARAVGMGDGHGVAVGKRADLMVLDAPSAHEAVLHQARRLLVIKAGRIIAQDGRLVEMDS